MVDVSEAEVYRRFLGGLKQHVRKAVRREAARSKTKLTLAQAIEFALVEDPSHVNRNPAATPRAAPPRRDRDPDAMDLDTVDGRGRLLPLSEAPRKYLSDKGGCCRSETPRLMKISDVGLLECPDEGPAGAYLFRAS